MAWKAYMILVRKIHGQTGKLSQSHSADFKSTIKKVIKGTMAREEEQEGYGTKGKILVNSIK